MKHLKGVWSAGIFFLLNFIWLNFISLDLSAAVPADPSQFHCEVITTAPDVESGFHRTSPAPSPSPSPSPSAAGALDFNNYWRDSIQNDDAVDSEPCHPFYEAVPEKLLTNLIS